MADTFTPTGGHLAKMTYDAKVVNIRGELRVSVNRNKIEISCLGDTFVPFRSYTLGMYDQMSFTVPVPLDSANDGCAEIIANSIAGVADTLIIYDYNAGNTLLSGEAFADYEYAASMDDVQLLNVTFTFTGALTGDLVV
ncbi:MAG: hypothetical protein WC565_09600 [Parcubacteria group bacterium]